MKKRKWRHSLLIGAGSLVISVFLCALIIAALFGLWFGWQMRTQSVNSKKAVTIVQPKAETYLQNVYPEQDFEIVNAIWSWYDNCYRIRVEHQSGEAFYFYLSYNTNTLELEMDGYAGGSVYAIE